MDAVSDGRAVRSGTGRENSKRKPGCLMTGQRRWNLRRIASESEREQCDQRHCRHDSDGGAFPVHNTGSRFGAGVSRGTVTWLLTISRLVLRPYVIPITAPITTTRPPNQIHGTSGSTITFTVAWAPLESNAIRLA